MDSSCEIEDECETKERKKPGETAANIAELQKLKEKLKRAKDEAVQSWLDSRPLIDELEKLQSQLADAKSRTISSNGTISELESELENLNISIRIKKEEELKVCTMINRINQALQSTQEELEQLKLERDEKHRARLKLKQVLRLKRQNLRTLQLTVRAVRLESEAFGASADEARRYISLSQTDDTMVEITREEYNELTKRARDETSLAEWRIAVSTEQKQATEGSRDTATRRLRNLHSNNGSRKREQTHVDAVRNQNTEAVEAVGVEQQPIIGVKTQASLQVKSSRIRKPQKRFKKSESKNKYSSKKKKSPFFCGIRTLVLKIKRYFK